MSFFFFFFFWRSCDSLNFLITPFICIGVDIGLSLFDLLYKTTYCVFQAIGKHISNNSEKKSQIDGEISLKCKFPLLQPHFPKEKPGVIKNG
jgi:hypothetical protein